eukprot:2007904-Pyramimonas_sp.AAC.1
MGGWGPATHQESLPDRAARGPVGEPGAQCAKGGPTGPRPKSTSAHRESPRDRVVITWAPEIAQKSLPDT